MTTIGRKTKTHTGGGFLNLFIIIIGHNVVWRYESYDAVGWYDAKITSKIKLGVLRKFAWAATRGDTYLGLPEIREISFGDKKKTYFLTINYNSTVPIRKRDTKNV